MGPVPFSDYLEELRDKGKAAFREKHGDRFLFLTSQLGARGNADEQERTAETTFQCYRVPLDEEPVVIIGRKSDCDITIPDQSVSGQHATLRLVGGVPHLIDNGSTNGTFVDEWRLEPDNKEGVPLGDRHALRLGSISMRYIADELFFRFAEGMLPEPIKD